MMASFTLAESPALLRAALPRNVSGLSTTRDWDEFATALLEDGLTLTALELYTELLESGKDLQCLKDYFSNPGNFEHTMPQASSLLHSTMIRTSSLSTFDSIELGRYSDDLDKEHDDKVTVLEFELRKAYETIKSLRGSLTEATEIGPNKTSGTPSLKPKVKSNDPIKPHEKRALNFLSHEYLMQQDLKLTAITLTEENGDQDFDDWDDVGLNIPKPPTLLELFRDYSTAVLSDKERLDRIKDLEDQLSIVTGQCLALKRENEALQLKAKKRQSSSVVSMKSDSEKLHRRGSSLVNQQDAVELMADMKQQPRNRSSPEIDQAGVAERDPKIDIAELASSRSSQRKQSESESVESEHSRDDHPTGTRRHLSNSVNSAVSVQSSVTVTEGEGGSRGEEEEGVTGVESEEDVITPLQKSRHTFPPVPEDAPPTTPTSTTNSVPGSVSTREERASTLTSDMSGSCSTLQNERQDGELEISVDQGKKQHMSVSFRQELLGVCQVKTDSRITLEVAKLAEPDFDIVQLLGRSLPHVVPNVSLSKREELIPILLCVLAKQSDSRSREQLLHMMFNLIKKPDRAQRQVIMGGCVAFSQLSGSTRVESELLPQMWEQITHKHFERRLLVAECCGVLAPYIPPELRGSLVLSMLKQMLSEDKAESVRQAVVKSLGVIVAFIDDEDKFKQCWELMLKGLNDPSQLVVTSACSVLLPALAAWAYELGSLESELVSYFLHQLLTCIKQVSRTDGESGAVEQSQHQILTLTHLVPWHYATILQTGPFSDSCSVEPEDSRPAPSFPTPLSPLLDVHIIIGDETRLSVLVAGFEKEISSKGFTPWKSLDWFQNEFLNKITRVIVALGFSQSELVHSLSNLLSTYCTYLGHTYTHTFIRPYFERCLKLPKHNPGAALAEGRTQLTTAVLPVYMAGVLGCFHKDESLMLDYLRNSVVDLALNFAPLDSLRATLAELCRERRRHLTLLQGLQDLSSHSSFQVRRYVAILVGVAVRQVDEKLITKMVVPLLIRLSQDSEISVKVDTVGSFGVIMETVTSKDVLMQVHEQFEVFMSEDQFRMDHQMVMAVLKTLAKIGPHTDPVFRDEFIMPKLSDVAAMNNTSQNVTKRQDIALALLEGYSNISECFMSMELLSTYVIPGLECLQRDVEDLLPEKTAAVEQLLDSFNTKVHDYRKQELSTEHTLGDGKASAFLKKFKPNFDRTDLNLSTSKFFRKKN